MVETSIVASADFNSPSRRGLMAGCAGLAAAGALSPGSAWASPPRRAPGDLFAFTSPDLTSRIFALAFAVRPFEQDERDPLTVRLHAGRRAWTIGPFALRSTAGLTEQGDRIFCGRIHGHGAEGAAVGHLVAVAAPVRTLDRTNIEVWAEVLGADGARARIGNPMAAYLLARNDADGMARTARLIGSSSPDPLGFDPSRPEGFTFAAANGRRPEDVVGSVVRTVLAGAPTLGGEEMRYVASRQFPYFATVDAA